MRKFGGVLVPVEEWKCWQGSETKLPAVSSLEQANGVALADAWRMGGATRTSGLEEVVPMLRRRLLGADTLGGFVEAATVGARVEKLYFDGPQEEDWPALAIGSGQPFLAFDANWVFMLSGKAPEAL